jgi:hypothetical protein
MSLNDIIGRVIEIAEDANGTIDKNLAARAGVPLVMEDDEAIGECVRDTVWRRVGTLSKQLSRPCHPSRATGPAPAPLAVPPPSRGLPHRRPGAAAG